MSVQRGGTVLTTGKIGYVKPIRQEMLLPGETFNARVSGSVNLETLRERDVLRINSNLAVFATPVRWLDENWPDYIKGGYNVDPQFLPVSTFFDGSSYGLGGDDTQGGYKFWKEAPLRVFNEWYKWPENPDATGVGVDGIPAVNLPHSWTRCRDDVLPDDTADYEMPSGSFDVQDLAKLQSRFATAMDRDVLSFNRYLELIKDVYGTDSTREVDKVPILIDQSSLNVTPRLQPATDNAGLGQYASVYDFGVDFRYKFTAPEHMIITYMLVVRFSPITKEQNPLLSNAFMDWSEVTGNPDILATAPPVSVNSRSVFESGSNFSLGYQAAGWQWRSGWNLVGTRIDNRDSFPVLQVPTNSTEAKDATRRVDAFRSGSLGDFKIDLFFDQQSISPLHSAIESYTAGMSKGSKDKIYPGVTRVK